jgi:hypothetical protein
MPRDVAVDKASVGIVVGEPGLGGSIAMSMNAAALKSAELHMYAKVVHGFGMRQQGIPTDHWVERFSE